MPASWSFVVPVRSYMMISPAAGLRRQRRPGALDPLVQPASEEERHGAPGGRAGRGADARHAGTAAVRRLERDELSAGLIQIEAQRIRIETPTAGGIRPTAVGFDLSSSAFRRPLSGGSCRPPGPASGRPEDKLRRLRGPPPGGGATPSTASRFPSPEGKDQDTAPWPGVAIDRCARSSEVAA